VPASEYAGLKYQVESLGLMRPQHRYFLSKLALNTALLILGLLGLRLAATSAWWWCADVVFLAFAFVQLALLGHDIVHLQFVRAGRLNTVIGLILGNLLVGVSRGWWNANHSAHHAHPNVMDSDPNLDILFLACTPEQALTRPRWVHWIILHQTTLLIPVFCLEFFSMHQQSIAFAIDRGKGWKRAELWLLAVHFAVYGGLLVAALGVGGAVMFAFVHHLLTGLYMASIFAPNHKGMPLTSGSAPSTFLREQVLTSRNIRGNPVIDIVYGGLNYQIEHHLFPTMACNNLRHAAPIVRAYCESRAIPYCETDVVGSWRAIMGHFREVSRALDALL